MVSNTTCTGHRLRAMTVQRCVETGVLCLDTSKIHTVNHPLSSEVVRYDDAAVVVKEVVWEVVPRGRVEGALGRMGDGRIFQLLEESVG